MYLVWPVSVTFWLLIFAITTTLMTKEVLIALVHSMAAMNNSMKTAQMIVELVQEETAKSIGAELRKALRPEGNECHF